MTVASLDRIEGVLLGTALGDALGLPLEGLSRRRASKMLAKGPLRFRLLGSVGFVSDDTEQSALVAQVVTQHPGEEVRFFRWALLGWFLRLPWGIGMATLKACARIALGLKRSGTNSAGNGAAMRSAVLGVAFPQASTRVEKGRALAEVTHLDARAVEGALYVAELTHLAAGAAPTADRSALVREAMQVVTDPSLREALNRALALAESKAPSEQASHELGTTGFVTHTLGFGTWCFAAAGDSFDGAMRACLGEGGDTDSIGAILGAWLGALHGAAALPGPLLSQLHDGPFGPSHLRQLARAVHAIAEGRAVDKVTYSAVVALLRNLALMPVILAHGFWRLVPW